MKYCPNIPCPHRERVGSPAEFLDHVIRCSDCGTRLVASEQAAIDGRGAAAFDPYRMAADVPAKDPAPLERRANHGALGVALIVGGILLGAIFYASSSRPGAYMIAWGPILYGAFTVLRRAPLNTDQG